MSLDILTDEQLIGELARRGRWVIEQSTEAPLGAAQAQPVEGSIPSSSHPCPRCGRSLEKVSYRPGAGSLNRDQWESSRAGDWWCEACPDNGRGNAGAYYWDRELVSEARDLEFVRPLDSHLVMLLGACSTVLGSAHPVSTPAGGETWMLEADRTEISHLMRWLQSRLDPRAPRPYLYGGRITVNNPIDGLGFETRWAAARLPVGTEIVLLVLR